MLQIDLPLKHSFLKVQMLRAKIMKLRQKHIFSPGIVIPKLSSQNVFYDVFSDLTKQKFIEKVEKMKWRTKEKNAKEAAVLIPLCYINNMPSLIMTLRSSNIGRNKSDVSFPGGMRETSDKDVIELALRETKEEIGLADHVIQVWTTLPTITMNRGGMNVTPVVAFAGSVSLKDLVINKNEVEQVFAVGLETLCNPNHQFYTEFKTGYVLPVFIIGEYHLWGLTAGIIHQFLKLLLPHVYKHKLPHVLKNLNWNCSK